MPSTGTPSSRRFFVSAGSARAPPPWTAWSSPAAAPGRRRPEPARLVVQAVPPTVSPSIRSVGWPTPTGTLWPSLPQMPTPVSSAMSLPIMRDARQRVGAVADQRRALHRVLDLAVLDPERLAGREHELAAGDVDLAAAEVGGVEAASCMLATISSGSCVAAEHVGVGHARHRHVRDSSRAGRCRWARTPIRRAFSAVLDVAAQDAVLDQHVALGRRCLRRRR